MSLNTMIMETLRGMLIGIPGVFAVLGVFYITLRILMRNKDDSENE